MLYKITVVPLPFWHNFYLFFAEILKIYLIFVPKF
jgi:hypothetical protein